ncbi:MAG: energy-coupled thiamine transporter ThiT [Oscillospiraceae bacterium]
MKKNTQRMVTTAIMIALAGVLSMIKIWQMPLGGSVTLLSMLPIALLSIQYGVKWGLASAFLYSLLQMSLDLGGLMSWGLTPLIFVGAILFDYVLAYTAIGLAGIFRKKGISGICLGIGIGLTIRFFSHFISGSIVFSAFCPEGWNVFLYSLAYNGTYMLPEMIFTVIGGALLFKLPQINKLMAGDNLTA